MLAWDALVLLAAMLDGMRLPRADKLSAARSWSNAPSLDSQTEIELTIENNGSVIIECRLIDDLPPALRDASGQQEPDSSHCLPARPGKRSLSRGTPGARRLHHRPALHSLSLAAFTRRTLGDGAACPDRARLSRVAHRRRAANIPGPQPTDRPATAANASAWTWARLRKPARLPRRRRHARHLLDRQRASRKPDHAPVPDRAQPARVDRARLRTPDALPRSRRPGHQRCATACRRKPPRTLQARPRMHSCRRTCAAGIVLRRSRRPARLRPDHPAASSARTRCRPSPPDDRTAGTGSR